MKTAREHLKKSDVENIRGRIELTHRMFDDKLTTTISMIANERKAFSYNNQGFYEDVYRQACIPNPTQPVYDENGKYVERDVYFYNNPVTAINEREPNTAFATYGLPEQWNTVPYKVYRSGQCTLAGQPANSMAFITHMSTIILRRWTKRLRIRYGRDYRNDLIELTATWNETIGKNKFTVVAGYNYEDVVDENFSASNRNFATDVYSYNHLGSGLE